MDGGSWHCTGGNDQDHPQEKEKQTGKAVEEGQIKSLELADTPYVYKIDKQQGPTV